MPVRLLLACCGVAMAVAATACSPGAEGVPGGGSSAGLLDVGEYQGSAASTFPTVAGTTVRLVVVGDAISVSAGCNSLGWSYQLAGDRLVVTAGASTMIGCAEELADQDARLAAFIEAEPTLAPSADGFTLTAADGTTLVLLDRVVADPDRALEETRWQLNGVTAGDVAQSAVGFETVELVFNEGSVDVVTGCSAGRAAYEIDGAAVVLGTLALVPLTVAFDPVACVPGVREAEAALVAVFGGRADVAVRADRLDLSRGETGLNFLER